MNKKALLVIGLAGIGVWGWYRLAKAGQDNIGADQYVEAANDGFLDVAIDASGQLYNEFFLANDMNLSTQYIELLKKIENPNKKGFNGVRWFQHLDSLGLPTIGYGHLILEGENFSNGLSSDEVEELFANDLSSRLRYPRMIKTALTQGQFDAVFDFVYNAGQGHFLGISKTTKGFGVNPLKAFNEKGAAAGMEQIALYYSKLVNLPAYKTSKNGLIRRSQTQQNMAGRGIYAF